MKAICSYCAKSAGEKEPLSDPRVTHVMCSDCFDNFKRQLDGLALNDYLDGFDAPVLILNRERRVVALNKKAAAATGKPTSEVFGLLAGEAMECDFARLPGGCGKTVHCETCTIRRVVMQTLETGQALNRTTVKLERNGIETEIAISTTCVDGMVRVVIEE